MRRREGMREGEEGWGWREEKGGREKEGGRRNGGRGSGERME